MLMQEMSSSALCYQLTGIFLDVILSLFSGPLLAALQRKIMHSDPSLSQYSEAQNSKILQTTYLLYSIVEDLGELCSVAQCTLHSSRIYKISTPPWFEGKDVFL